MKKLTRMVAFSGAALLITSLWDKGFIVKFDFLPLIMASAAVAVIFYIIRPITKIIFLPINFFTFGLVSLVFYCFLFFLVTTQTSIITITAWDFPGLKLFGLTIPKLAISYLQNIVLSSLSVSYIIRTLEKLI